MIFVTGGTGFLGRHLIPELCRAGFALRVLTRRPAQHPWLKRYPRLTVVEGDLLDGDTLLKAADGCRYVIHAGGMFRFWGDERAFEATNARGTENALNAAAQTGVERFIHISTIAVIGYPDPAHVIDETYPPRPADAYQRSKWQAEQIAMRACQEQKVPVIVLRPGAYYGPLGQYAFNRLFFKDPMRGIIMQINGGRYVIFPAYIADVVQGVMKALECGRVGEVYNICGDWISHRDAFDIICQEANIRWPRLPIPDWLDITTARALEALALVTRQEPFWPLNLRSYVYNNWRVSNDKARRELGFVPTDFREGARKTIAWYRAGQPDDLPEFMCST
ncbi:MAG: NAD-dependent epimerase/dehydratase family protein [Chloroflexi bacterium]|nr:NAD-dependent epimerase/dehydratase family protein [Chloroflexota bacterium]